MLIEANFHMGPQWDGGTIVYLNSQGHKNKMAAIPI